MRIYYSRQARDTLKDGDKLSEELCYCGADPTCEQCDGTGTVYFSEISAEDTAAILENLSRQGVPVGKLGH